MGWFSIELTFSDSRDIHKIVCRRVSQSVDHRNIHELTLYTPSLQYCWQQKQVIIFIHHYLWYSRKINNNKLMFYRTLHDSKLLYIYCCCYEYITSHEQRFLSKGHIQSVCAGFMLWSRTFNKLFYAVILIAYPSFKPFTMRMSSCSTLFCC